MSEPISLKTIEPEKKEEEKKSQAQIDYEEGQKFLKQGDTTQAANAFHNALISFQKENNESGIANASDKLGDICLEKEKYDQAISNWDVAKKICAKNDDRTSVFSLQKKEAKLYWQWGKLDEAINLHLNIFDEYQADNNPQGTVDTLETLSEIYMQKGAKAEAVDCLRTAAAIHKNFSHTNFYNRLMEQADKLEQS